MIHAVEEHWHPFIGVGIFAAIWVLLALLGWLTKRL